MEHITDTPEDPTAVTPVDEAAEPISIRKLDRLETTSASLANGG
jgi:hypothetical protein